MKIWKIVGITGIMFASLIFSGVAEARRYSHHSSYNNHGTCQNYGNQNYGHYQRPYWAGERGRERFQHNRHQQPQHHNWNRSHNRYARASHWR